MQTTVYDLTGRPFRFHEVRPDNNALYVCPKTGDRVVCQSNAMAMFPTPNLINRPVVFDPMAISSPKRADRSGITAWSRVRDKFIDKCEDLPQIGMTD